MSTPVKNDPSTKPSLAPVEGSRDAALLAFGDAIHDLAVQHGAVADQLAGLRREVAELRAETAVNAARLQGLAGDPMLAARIEQHLHVERLSLESLKTLAAMKNSVLADLFEGAGNEMTPEVLMQMYEMGLGPKGKSGKRRGTRPQESTPKPRGG